MWDALSPATQCNATATVQPVGTVTDLTGVRLTSIVYNPAGNDIEGERVVIQNISAGPEDLTGWTLSDESDTTFTFPSFKLQPGATVTVWVKRGADSGSELFWGRKSPVWNNDSDTAFLKDKGGTLIDRCTYTGGATEAPCMP